MRRGRADALRAALGMEAVMATHQRDDKAEHRSFDQAGDDVLLKDVISGLIKASVFGFIVSLMGCHHGFHSKGGAQGVGTATTHAVVSASILILLSNYVLTALLFGK